MNDSSICHVNLAGGFRGGERQTFLLMEELASRGHKQCLIAKANSALAAHAKLIEDLEVIESSFNGFDCRTYFKDAPLLHFHESRVFAAIWSFGIATEKNISLPEEWKDHQDLILSVKVSTVMRIKQ